MGLSVQEENIIPKNFLKCINIQKGDIFSLICFDQIKCIDIPKDEICYVNFDTHNPSYVSIRNII